MTGDVLRALIERCVTIRGVVPKGFVLPSNEAWKLVLEARPGEMPYTAPRFIEALFHPPTNGEAATYMGVPVRADDSRRRILIRL